MKGYRTVIFNVASVLVMVAGIVLQYLDQLGLDDRTVAFIGMGLTVFNAVANMYLRSITTTPLGEKY
jgi:small basic protein